MNPQLRKRALLLSFCLVLIMLGSCLYLYMRHINDADTYTAYIYQDGTLVKQINLSSVAEEYTLTLYDSDGGMNTILIHPGSIAVTSADCPDQVCVHQGAIRNSLLPITCLPHKLVIELKANRTDIDTITY